MLWLMLKNRSLLIAGGVLVFFLVLGGGYFLFVHKAPGASVANQTDNQDTGPLKLSPNDIGLTLSASPDKKRVKFAINKLDGINGVEYQVTYEADSTAQEIAEGGDKRVDRGITGDSKINTGDSSYESPWLDLGSCSKNICRYDTGVNSVDMVLKITKDDGKVYEVEQKLSL